MLSSAPFSPVLARDTEGHCEQREAVFMYSTVFIALRQNKTKWKIELRQKQGFKHAPFVSMWTKKHWNRQKKIQCELFEGN